MFQLTKINEQYEAPYASTKYDGGNGWDFAVVISDDDASYYYIRAKNGDADAVVMRIDGVEEDAFYIPDVSSSDIHDVERHIAICGELNEAYRFIKDEIVPKLDEYCYQF